MKKYKAVGTKVKPEVKERFGRLCRERGTTEYEMLQMFIDYVITRADDHHEVDPELAEAIADFNRKRDGRGTYNLADPACGREVTEAVYITRDTGGREGARAAHVTHTSRGWRHSDNAVQIFERIVELLLPELYRKLRRLAVAHGCRNLAWLMRKLADSQYAETFDADLRETFDDVRADNGRRVEYGQRTRRKKHFTPDTAPHQQPNDNPTPDTDLPQRLEDEPGFKPHGGEW